MNKVKIYKNAKYDGSFQELGPGRHNWLTIGNDELSSLEVPPGWKATLWWDTNFNGPSWLITSSTSYVGSNWNDETTSIAVNCPAVETAEGTPSTLAFVGANAYLDLGPVSLSPVNGPFQGFTVEAWVYFDSRGANARIIDLFQTCARDNILLARNGTSSDLCFGVWKAGVVKSLVAPGVIANGQWLHLVATLDGDGNARIFVNGVQKVAGLLQTPDNLTRSSAYVGRSGWSADAYFLGQLGEVRLWNVARTEAEIKRMMNGRLSGREQGLLRYLRLDEASGTVAKDLSGNRDATICNPSGVMYAMAGPALREAADLPTGMQFDGGQDFLTLPPLVADFSKAFTLEAWVYHDDSRAWTTLFHLGNGLGTGVAADDVLIGRSGATNDLFLRIYQGSTQVFSLLATGVLTVLDWQHIAVTMSGWTADGTANYTIYVDAVVKASLRGPAPNHLPRSKSYIAKCNWDQTLFFKGRMAEVRLWTVARTSDELLVGMQARLDPQEPGLCAYYPLDEQGATLAHDASPSALHASMAGGLRWNQAVAPSLVPFAPPSQALLFNGIDTYVELPALSDDLSKGFTIEAWVYFDGTESWARIVDLGAGSAIDNILLARAATTSDLSLTIYGATSGELRAPGVLETATWMHVAATVNSAGMATLYKNGVVMTSGQIALPRASVVRSSSYLGKSNWSENPLLKGRLAEVRIWTVVRSQSELRRLMNQPLSGTESGLSRLYALDEGTGTVAIDKVPHSGTPSAAPHGAIKGSVQRLQALSPTTTAGAMGFDGSGDFVQLPPLNADLASGFTIEAWVYFDGQKESERICDFGNGAGSDNIVFGRWQAQQALYLAVYRGSSEQKLVTPPGVIRSQVWTHVAATINVAGKATIYVNGVAKGTGSVWTPRGGGVRSSSYLGRSNWGIQYDFKGRMTDFRLWSVARSSEDIQAGMTEPQEGNTPGLCVHYPLDEATESSVRDRAQRHGEVFTGTHWGSLPHRTTRRFEGTGTYVQLPALTEDLSKGFTIEAWVFFDGTESWARIVDFGSGPASDNILLARAGTSTDLTLAIYRGSSYSELKAVGVLETGRWMHLAVTMDSISSDGTTGMATIYVDGVSQASDRIQAPRVITRNNCYIGKSNWSADVLFRGRMSEVRLFSVGRSEADIQAMMRRPLLGSEDGLQRYYRLDVAAGAVATDLGPALAHGTVNGPLTRVAMAFDGVNDYVRLPTLTDSLSSRGFTLEAWVYFTGVDDWGRIFELATKPGLGTYNISLSRVASTNDLALRFFRDTSTAVTDLRATAVIPPNTWIHIAATFAAPTWDSSVADWFGQAAIYINGELKNTARVRAPLDATRSSSFIGKIDGYPAGSYMFRGRMAEVRIWSGARTQAQLAAAKDSALLGTESGLLHYYPLNDAAGTTVKDYVVSSPAAATLVGAGSRPGLPFDGSTDYLLLPPLTADFSAGFTIQAWVYFSSVRSWARIVDLGNGQTNDNIYLCRYSTSNQLRLTVYNGSTSSQVTSGSGLITGKWIHVAATMNSSGLATLYIDGVSVGSNTLSVRPKAGITRTLCYAGESNWDVDPLFEGRMAELALFTKDRSAAEISASKDNGLTGSEPALLHYYRLTEGPGLTMRDSVSSAARAALLYGSQADSSLLRPDGRALSFDGFQGVAELPRVTLPPALTLEAWVYLTGTPKENETIVTTGCDSAGNSVALCRSGTTNDLRVLMLDRGLSTLVGLTASSVLRSNTWIHLCVSISDYPSMWSTRQIVLYVNAHQLVSAPMQAMQTVSYSPDTITRLGMQPDGSSQLQGRLTEVRLWNRVRSAAEIAATLSTRLQGTESGLVRYYPLTESSGVIAHDGVAHPSATISGNSPRFPRPLARVLGTLPQGALEFDGLGNYVALPMITADLSLGFAIEAWVYFDGVPRDSRIVELGRSAGSDVISFGCLGSSNNLTLQVYCEDRLSSLSTTTGVILDKTWMHVAASVTATGAATLFVNGAVVRTGMVLPPSPGVRRAKSYLGKSSSSSVLFKGRLAEVKLWNRARSASEITAQMNQSLWREDYALIAYYRLDETDGTTAHDATGAMLDGKILGLKPVWGASSPLLLPPPQTPGSLSFDGVSDWVALPALSADFSRGFTLEAWVNFADSTTLARLIDLAEGAGANDNIALSRPGISSLSLSVYRGSIGSSLSANVVLGTNVWMHVAATLGDISADGTTGLATIYVNGVSQGSARISAPNANLTRALSYVGKSNVSADPLFHGRMAEVRLWTVARSQAEIQRTMGARLRGSEPGLYANFRLNEADGERAGDVSKNALHAWARGTATFDRSEPLPTFDPAVSALPSGVLPLDGATYVTLPALAPAMAQPVPDGLCLEAYVYCGEVTQTARFIELGNAAAGSDNVYLGKSGSDLVFAVQVGTQAIQLVTAKSVLASQKWTHVAASVDENGHVVVCKDGVPLPIGSNIVQPPAAVLRSDVFLGRSLSGATLNGSLTEARIWTTPRTPRQIAGYRSVRLSGDVAGLARCYSLLAPFGKTAKDSTSQHGDGVVQGNPIQWDVVGPDFSATPPSAATTPASGALAFDGASTYVRLPAVTVDLSKGFTVEAWIYAEGVQSWSRIVELGQGMRLENIFFARYGTSNQLALRVYYDGANYSEIVTTQNALSLNTWTHCAVTLDASGLVKIYVNGSAVSLSVSSIATTKMPKAGITRSRAYIGKSNWYWDQLWKGRMAEVRLWNRARSLDEINGSLNTRLTGTELGLFGYYRLDEQSGPIVANRSSRAAAATAFGELGWGAAVPALAAEPAMTTPSTKLAVAPPTATATQPIGTTTWGTGISTGDSLIDTSISTYVSSGISFNLLGLPSSLTLSGAIAYKPLQQTVAFTGTITVAKPANLPGVTGTLTLTKSASPMVFSARFQPTFSLSQLVHDAAALVGNSTVTAAVDALLVPPLSAFNNATVIVASGDGYDADLGDFYQGINFYASQKVSDLPGISLLPDKWKIDLLHLDQRLLILAIGLRSPTDYRLSGRAKLDIPLIPGNSVKLTFNEIGLNTAVGPGKSSFGIAHRFTLELFGEKLVFQGAVAVEKGSTGEDVVVWGALDPDENQYPDGRWHNPFGCPGVVIDGLGVQLKLADRPPFLGLGIRGGVHIGDGLLGASLALNFDPANIDQTILAIDSPEGIDLPRLVNAVINVTKIPGLDILTTILNVRLTDLQLYFAPNGGSIAGKDYDRGVSIGATVDLWGYHASIFGCIDVNMGGLLKGNADLIDIKVGIVTLIQFSDVLGSSGPSVDIALTTARQGIYYSGRLVLLNGLYDNYQELSISSSGFSFLCPTDMGALAVEASSSKYQLSLSPKFVFGFSVFGISVHVDIGGTITNRIDTSGYFQQLSFHFHVCGLDFDVGPVSWGITITDLKSVARVFEHFFGDMVKRFFTDTLGQAVKAAFDWVKNNLTDLAEEAVALFKSAGAAVADIATNVYEMFDVAVDELIGYLGTGINEAASILKDSLGLAAEAAAKALGTAFGAASAAVKNALSGVGYDLADIADEVWGTIDDAVGYLDPTSW